MALGPRIVLGLLLIALPLAGCVEEPPTGSFVTDQEGATAATQGSIAIQYTAFHSPADETAMGAPGTIEDASQGAVPARCGGDDAAGAEPTGAGKDYQCVDPSTNVTASFASLPLPGSATYTLYFVGAAGEQEIGALAYNEHAEHNGMPMFAFETTFAEDLSGMYEAVELRLGAFPYARAPVAAGENAFTVLPEVLAGKAEVVWEGMTLTAKVMGMPANATLVGWLVTVDEAGVKTHDQKFELTGAETTFTAPRLISEYQEFHVHVGDSKINVAIAMIPAPAA